MRIVLNVVALLAFTSCATMVNGRYQEVKVDSYPGHAAVAVNCGDVHRDAGFTPVTLTLPRRANACQVTLSKEGYVDRVFTFQQQESRAVVANAIAGAPIGVIGAVVGLVLGDELGASDELASFGWGAGVELGAAPGRQYDRHTGGAYKWVPGDVFVTLLRREPAL